MSIESWKAEFYPVPADQVEGEVEATRHSIRKWKGLRKENLDRHDCYLSRDIVLQVRQKDWVGGHLGIDAGTCALCAVFYARECGVCVTCSLNKRLGMRCDYGGSSPFRLAVDRGDVEPMILELEGTLRGLLEGDDPEFDARMCPETG